MCESRRTNICAHFQNANRRKLECVSQGEGLLNSPLGKWSRGNEPFSSIDQQSDEGKLKGRTTEAVGFQFTAMKMNIYTDEECFGCSADSTWESGLPHCWHPSAPTSEHTQTHPLLPVSINWLIGSMSQRQKHHNKGQHGE